MRTSFSFFLIETRAYKKPTSQYWKWVYKVKDLIEVLSLF